MESTSKEVSSPGNEFTQTLASAPKVWHMPVKEIKGIPDISTTEATHAGARRQPVTRIILETSVRFSGPIPDGLKSRV